MDDTSPIRDGPDGVLSVGSSGNSVSECSLPLLSSLSSGSNVLFDSLLESQDVVDSGSVPVSDSVVYSAPESSDSVSESKSNWSIVECHPGFEVGHRDIFWCFLAFDFVFYRGGCIVLPATSVICNLCGFFLSVMPVKYQVGEVVYPSVSAPWFRPKMSWRDRGYSGHKRGRRAPGVARLAGFGPVPYLYTTKRRVLATPGVLPRSRGYSTRGFGLIDHKSRRMKFTVYQHYTMGQAPDTATFYDLAINMSGSELLFVNKCDATKRDTWRARTPHFYRVAQHWMSFAVTGMKMGIAVEGIMRRDYPTTDYDFFRHSGGAWSTTWNETEGDSHKPMSQFVDNARNIAPRYRFRREAKLLDKSYRVAAFSADVANWSKRSRHRQFFRRYVPLRRDPKIGFAMNGIDVEKTQRAWMPLLHLHQPDQFLQYQANTIGFDAFRGAKQLTWRVKKTWYVNFVDRRERQNLMEIAPVFLPHPDETFGVNLVSNFDPTYPAIDTTREGCTGQPPIDGCNASGCDLAKEPRVGPVPDPPECRDPICGVPPCVPLVCPEGQYPYTVDVNGCANSCAVGQAFPGGGVGFLVDVPATLACAQTCEFPGSGDSSCGYIAAGECAPGQHLERATGITGPCTVDGPSGSTAAILAQCVDDP